ncbi:MAG TPA: DNA mismatch repair protein MutS [Candidatus Limnocylindrales bacterium]|nr:DNA mismatch repair protein MutS [Candidatus Limnocylindrales bacterium]
MSAEAQLTPMMAQYRRIQGELPKDALLLFRLGDFYEMFFEDAQTGSQLLNLSLTARNGVPMCGLPHHAANGYIARILKAGRKVAICDQTEEARPGKLVQREVTQILSPGTHFDERMLVAERNNFLAAVNPSGKTFGLALVDLTTGDFLTTELENDSALLAELERLRPAEIIFPTEAITLRDLLSGRSAPLTPSLSPSDGERVAKPGEGSVTSRSNYGWVVSGYDDWTFAPETAFFMVKEQFKVASLDGFGLKDKTAAIGAAGGALHYLTQNLRRDVKHLTRISFYQRSDFLTLDYTTLRHLEILEPQHHDAPRNASLYGALNKTVTPMGARLLRQWLSQPLAKVEPIRQRQDAVQTFIENSFGLDAFRQQLAKVRDLERTLGRLSSGSGNARDLVALRLALEQIPTLKEILKNLVAADVRRLILRDESQSLLTSAATDELKDAPQHAPALIEEFNLQISESPDLVELISRAIVDEPPLPIKEGGMIRDGFDAALNELRTAQRGGKDWIAKLQADEITATGISSLKVRFNSVFGYYIEVTKSNLDKVPPHYHRKQTVANGERFITPELKDMEGKILGAEERGVKLEYEIFQHVREEVLGQLPKIQQTASTLAQLDVLASFAETARLHNYSRPQVADAGVLQIRDGRHPVLEQQLVEERFVPNDTLLGSSGRESAHSEETEMSQSRLTSAATEIKFAQIALITGPNMAGKSTYIRQVALLTLLAHTGSFVPAAEARIDLVDRIFTRIGASDDLSRGQSTFMVEMTETANILNNATARSLIVLDEIGRGTSTFDGLSLAWSIVEHLHNAVGAKTLFATHYHELTELSARLPRLKNFNVAVREWHDQIVFLRKIVEGGTDKSYGIQVARLAGVPKEVLERAKQILSNLEESELTPEGNVRPQTRQRGKLQNLPVPPQMDLFG